MSNDADIKIGFQTTADTSGAEKTAKAIDKVKDSEKSLAAEIRETTAASKEANAVQRAADLAEAKARKAARKAGSSKGTGIDDATVAQGLANAIPGGARLAPMAAAHAGVAIEAGVAALPVAAIASQFAVAEYLVGKISDLKQKLADQGVTLGEELTRELEVNEMIAGPFTGVVNLAKEAWSDFTNLLSGGTDGVVAAYQKAAEAQANLQKLRLSMATEAQSFSGNVYQKELDALLQQEKAILRIQKLRGQYQSLAEQRAANAVEIAQQDGGDVGLARARQLTTQLQGKLAALGNDIAQAEASAETASRKYDAAYSKWSRMSAAIDANLREDQAKLAGMLKAGASQKSIDELKAKIASEEAALGELSSAVDDAKAKLDEANQNVADQKGLFEEKKNLIVENFGIELRKLEEEVQSSVSRDAGKELDKIHNILTEANQLTIESVNQAVQETKTQQDTNREATVTAIRQLAPTAQDQAAITTAADSVQQAITAQGNAIVQAMSQWSPAFAAVLQKLNAQQAQINQLFSRVR